MDENTEALKRAILEQVNNDVADFVASLEQDLPSGVPPPPKVEYTEVSLDQVDVDLLGFDQQK